MAFSGSSCCACATARPCRGPRGCWRRRCCCCKAPGRARQVAMTSPTAAAGTATATVSAWIASGPGVKVCLLSGDAQVVSMLVRFEAGAGVNDHHHALDEDCLVLEGEMFLGDILLQPGDYQLARAGGGHFGEFSDVGVLFFFHGALDPVLRQPRP